MARRANWTKGLTGNEPYHGENKTRSGNGLPKDQWCVVSSQNSLVSLAIFCPFTTFTCQALSYSVVSFIQFICLILISKYFADRFPSYSAHSQDNLQTSSAKAPLVDDSAFRDLRTSRMNTTQMT